MSSRLFYPCSRRLGSKAHSIEQVCGRLERALPKETLVRDPDLLAKYNVDWLKQFHGKSQLVVKPANVDELSVAARICHETASPMVAQGGNTGLVGGATPISDHEVVISFERMHQIHSLDPNTGIVICDAGVILSNLDRYMQEHGQRIVPLDLGSKDSCQLGGNVATNAGGLRYIYFGSLRQSVVGLEAVKADGKRLDLLTRCRKDNMGIDLRQALIGSEGILGLVSKVALLCPLRPTAMGLGLVSCPSFESVWKLLKLSRSVVGSDFSAFEFMDEQSLRVLSKYKNIETPLAQSKQGECQIIVEVSSFSEETTQTKLTSLLESAYEADIISDAVLSESQSQFDAIWAIRHRIPSVCARAGRDVYKYDVSLPDLEMLPRLIDFFQQLVHEHWPRERTRLHSLGQSLQGLDQMHEVAVYGHLGDANVHVNVVVDGSPEFTKPAREMTEFMERSVFHWLMTCPEMQGCSFTGEHGVGQKRLHWLRWAQELRPQSREQAALRVELKRAWDPNMLLNPGKGILI